VLVERMDDEVELRAELRDADDGERAARPERLECLADDGEVPDRLEGVIGAAAREVADGGDRIRRRSVDGVGRAERPGELELRRDDVDRDDLRGAGEDAALDAT